MNKLEKMKNNNSLSNNLKEITFFSLILSVIINFISYNTNEYYILEQFLGLEFGTYNFIINIIPTFLIILISLVTILILFNKDGKDNIKTEENEKKDILNDNTLEKKKKEEDTIIKHKIKKASKVDSNKKKKEKSQKLNIENKQEEKDLPKKTNLKKKILKKKIEKVKKEYNSLEEIEKEFEKYNLLFVKRIYGKRTHTRKILELEKEVEKLKNKGVIEKNYTLFQY